MVAAGFKGFATEYLGGQLVDFMQKELLDLLALVVTDF